MRRSCRHTAHDTGFYTLGLSPPDGRATAGETLTITDRVSRLDTHNLRLLCCLGRSMGVPHSGRRYWQICGLGCATVWVIYLHLAHLIYVFLLEKSSR